MPACNGIVLLDKPSGISSHQATARVRRCFAGVRAGHGGSLDPLATGVLPIFLGSARRFAGYALTSVKSYRALIRLGVRTSTDDIEGEVISQGDFAAPDRSLVERAVNELTGKIVQIPPTHSAVHINGVRAYRLARAGLEVHPAPREVTVYNMEIVDYHYPDLSIAVKCSKGTYIRSIARDLGERLGVGGIVAGLRRTAVSGFDSNLLHGLDELEQLHLQHRPLEPCLLPPDAGLGHLPRASLSEAQIKALYHGLEISFSPEQDNAGNDLSTDKKLERIYDHKGRFYGLIQRSSSRLARSVRLMPAENLEF